MTQEDIWDMDEDGDYFDEFLDILSCKEMMNYFDVMLAEKDLENEP